MSRKMEQGQQKTFLTPTEVVGRWNDAVTIGTLANWRSKKEGPPFQKFGSRVRYPLALLQNWERLNTHMDFLTLAAGNDNSNTGTQNAAA